jgi:hypothetical protein
MATELLPREPGKRKTASVTIDAENRDQGKRYLITEMPATQAERWGRRLVAKMAREGIAVPAQIADLGMAALPSYPLLTYLSWVDDEALVGELMACVQAWPAGVQVARALRETDVEEPLTLTQLRMEVIALHVGFTLAVFLWSFLPALATAWNVEKPATLSTIPTSPETSPSS